MSSCFSNGDVNSIEILQVDIFWGAIVGCACKASTCNSRTKYHRKYKLEACKRLLFSSSLCELLEARVQLVEYTCRVFIEFTPALFSF